MKIQLLKYYLLFLGMTFGLLSITFGQSSNIGIPPIHNFDKTIYNGSPQNWDITQDKNGLMYFANNAGLLVFDGKYWECHKVSNQTIVRSVKVADDGRIFVGAQGELGYFSPGENGKLTYNSLNFLLAEEDRNYADVWNIEIIDKNVYFKTGSSIFLYKNNRLKVIYTGEGFGILTKIGKQIFVFETGKGILKLNQATFKPLTTNRNLDNSEMNGIFSFHGDTLLISTVKDGLFLYADDNFVRWKINDNGALERGSVYCSTKIDAETYAFGSSINGIFIINKKGQVIRHLNRKSGLQVNSVLSLFADNFKNLWLGLDNGIDYVETSSPFTYIYLDSDLKSMGYAIQIYKNQIYFGTANGVYRNSWQSYYNPMVAAPYQLVKESAGQVWNMAVHEGDLFLNHHEGTFIVNGNTANQIDARNGSWMQVAIGKNKLLSGHYNGLILLEKGDGWRKTYDFESDWRESCRVIVQDENGLVWISHPYRGLHKIRFNNDFSEIESIERYGKQQGFPSDLQIYAFKIGDEVVFCAKEGIYQYNKAENGFELNQKWNEIFGKKTRVKRLIEAKNGDIWYVTDAEVGILDIRDGGVYKNIKKRIFPKLANKMVDAFEEIYPFDDKNVFIATENGFMHYNPSQKIEDTTINVLIRMVQLMSNDSIIYYGNDLKSKASPSIPYKSNALRFRFSATYFADTDKNEFQYFLEGFDDKWSVWTKKSEIEYTNLNHGTYTLHLRAQNIKGTYSAVRTYSFRIAAPWYASKLAYTIYFVISGLIFFSLIMIPKKQFEREKAALQSEQEQTLLEQEVEYKRLEAARQHQISKLEKEKLELQIQGNNQELASNTMHLVQKSEVLQKIKNEIQKIAKTSKDTMTSKQLRSVVRKISTDERLDEDWQGFARHFDQVHGQFLQRIREKYPQLTPKDHRLCAYLRMNLVSKEIAPLMNISVRSVEVARYRMRKKLEIGNEVNLVEFMMEI
ncbi:MAG: ligand-binding sensor domain-containing protein/DNA-binding CsgD family transcriptional regulator [Saprospiraceae bacterium]|jgi:ligand-binding sensor domain-containing protein/DNA-binding CsgD family transcriptional regulator